MNVLDRVRQTIRRHDLARRESRVIVALSGGSDSMALAHLLLELERAGELSVRGVAHLNHQLRPEADADERFCAEAARAVGRTLFVDRVDVKRLAVDEHRSIEDAARVARYTFLARARAHFDADAVALGHTRDDQAETFLLRLLRGAGARGLAAMRPRRGSFIRPLLDCRRADLRGYLDARRIAFVHDSSNDDVGIPRNRVRAELLPLLETRFNPSIVDVLAGDADVAREEWAWMSGAAAELAGRIGRRTGDAWRLDAAALEAAPLALARLVVQRALNDLAGGRAVSRSHVDHVLALIRDRGGVPVDLPGQRLEREGADVVLRGRDAALPVKTNLFWYPLSIPGEVRLPEAGLVVTAETAAYVLPGDAAMGNQGIAVVQLNRSDGQLAVRNRRPGDRFRPLGLGGGKKLQDFFVDRKVARHERDGVPLVVDDGNAIVWVAGHAIDERFRVRDPAQAVVILRLKLLGESA
jgi:tRNA(Ile)-lysidine synthase